MNPDDLSEILTSRRPKVIWRNSEWIESNEISSDKSEPFEYNGKMLVVVQTVVQVTTKHTLLREYDPARSYDDAVDTFTHPPNPA